MGVGIRDGFIYAWLDRKYPRYYIGSHWGKEDDGYICSSNWMRSAYRRRPQDFRRRIVERHESITYKELIEKEQRWLDMIKPEELGKKYYNYQPKAKGWSWHQNDHTKAAVGKKIGRTNSRLMKAKWKDPVYRKSQLSIEVRTKWLDGTAKQWKITFPDGHIEVIKNLKEFCRIYKLDSGVMSRVGRGLKSRHQHKGFLCKQL